MAAVAINNIVPSAALKSRGSTARARSGFHCIAFPKRLEHLGRKTFSLQHHAGVAARRLPLYRRQHPLPRFRDPETALESRQPYPAMAAGTRRCGVPGMHSGQPLHIRIARCVFFRAMRLLFFRGLCIPVGLVPFDPCSRLPARRNAIAITFIVCSADSRATQRPPEIPAVPPILTRFERAGWLAGGRAFGVS